MTKGSFIDTFSALSLTTGTSVLVVGMGLTLLGDPNGGFFILIGIVLLIASMISLKVNS